MVESQPSKLLVASSILVSRSITSTLCKRPVRTFAPLLLHFQQLYADAETLFKLFTAAPPALASDERVYWF